MTDQELRELDAFCAERVMGWTLCTGDPERFTDHDATWSYRMKLFEGEDILVGRAYRVRHAPEGTPFNRQWHRFHPTTDDAPAMDVLRKITTKTNPRIINCGTCFYIEHGKDNWKVKGKTLPLAIAKFAKQLYREQKGEG